jgi:uncharacterized damage-inducible protein DinB
MEHAAQTASREIIATMQESPDPLRAQLIRLLDWEEAHVGFDKAVHGIPADRRGAHAAGFEHTAWQLVEHMRIAQKDLLAFCLDARYVHAREWPRDYWPPGPAPADEAAWTASLSDFRADREQLTRLVRDAAVNLFAPVPTGRSEQTYLRAILLVADHNAYHLGQLIAVRRALGIWP